MYVKGMLERLPYSAAEVEILLFCTCDVIATSVTLDPDGTGEDGNLGDWTKPEI